MARGRRRWLHRRGAVFRATLQPPAGDGSTGGTGTAGAGAGGTVGGGTPGGSPDAPAGRPARVRISITFGWPRPLPDWAGMAIRLLPGADGGDGDGGDGREPVDLLLASAATEPDLWCRLEPHRDVLACAFTTAVRHRVAGSDQIVVAVPVQPRPAGLDQLIAGEVPLPIRYRIDATEHRGTWHTLGELVLTELQPDDRQLRFAPPERGPRWFTAIRRLVYRLAQGRAARRRSASGRDGVQAP